MTTAQPPRCLGLIGGLGVGATVHYYRALASAHTARGVGLRLVMAHVDSRRVFAFLQTTDRVGLARYLADAIERLYAAGADVAAVAAVAPHVCVRELSAISPLPVVNLLDAVAGAVRASGIRRAAIFGTRLVMESAVFGSLESVDVITPTASDADYIDRAYRSLALSGERSEEHYHGLTRVAQALLRDGAEAIVLAGTDLAVIFDGATTPFPHVACGALHIDAILRALLEGTP